MGVYLVGVQEERPVAVVVESVVVGLAVLVAWWYCAKLLVLRWFTVHKIQERDTA